MDRDLGIPVQLQGVHPLVLQAALEVRSWPQAPGWEVLHDLDQPVLFLRVECIPALLQLLDIRVELRIQLPVVGLRRQVRLAGPGAGLQPQGVRRTLPLEEHLRLTARTQVQFQPLKRRCAPAVLRFACA